MSESRGPVCGQTIIDRYQPKTAFYDPIRQFKAFRKVYLIFWQKFNDRLRLAFTCTKDQGPFGTTMSLILRASYEIQGAWVGSKVEKHAKRMLNICFLFVLTKHGRRTLNLCVTLFGKSIHPQLIANDHWSSSSFLYLYPSHLSLIFR